MPFYPETQFFQTLAEYPKLLKIINDLTEGGKDDLQDLIITIRENEFDFGHWMERQENREKRKKIRAKWLLFYAGFTENEYPDQKDFTLKDGYGMELNSATIEIYKIMGRTFYQKFMEIPKQGQEKVGQALAAYVYLMQPSSTTCIKCQKDYNFEDADGRDGRLYCPACGNKFV